MGANDVCKANLHKMAELKLENLKLKLRAGVKPEELISELPPSTDDCGWSTGLSCAADIGGLSWTVWPLSPTPSTSCPVWRMSLELGTPAGLASAGSLSGSLGMDTAKCTCTTPSLTQNIISSIKIIIYTKIKEILFPLLNSINN